jgi:hypothetical protein
MASTAPRLVWVPPTTYLVAEGTGSPEGEHFRRAVKAVYAVAYTMKMQLKLEGQEFRMGGLEALWWVDRPGHWQDVDRGDWHWKVLMAVPESVDAQLMKLTRDSLVNRRRLDDAADVHLEILDEGTCVEAMHVGPYATEGETIQLMHAFMVESRYQRAGPHHEIYLSDPRRTAPERIRTILRQPVH